VGVLTLMAVAPGSGLAQDQSSQSIALPPAVGRALEIIRDDNAWTIQNQRAICEIPAPPFNETRRAAEYRRRFEALGLEARTDSIGNVIARRPGRVAGPAVVLAAHLDTVFPEGTYVTVRQRGDTLRAPGIADDCRGLAVLLAVARALDAAQVSTEAPLLFVGTVGEEGAGNLRGARYFFDHVPAESVQAFVAVDLTHTQFGAIATGSNRYEYRFTGPGGHSFNAFGMPNPIHAMGRAIARIAGITVPATPRTTFNVGVVRGGTGVNAIADTASFMVDLRSESASELARLDSMVEAIASSAAAEERGRWPQSRVPLGLSRRTIGLRPAGSTPDSSFLVRATLEAAQRLGITPEPGPHSTDANIPISRGIPAIAIGHGGTSGGEHALSEWYVDGADGYRGAQWALLVAARLAGVR
jgi:acetylornithine deacetylase/succinyl-diaminopimelate desuccinylase-like protein